MAFVLCSDLSFTVLLPDFVKLSLIRQIAVCYIFENILPLFGHLCSTEISQKDHSCSPIFSIFRFVIKFDLFIGCFCKRGQLPMQSFQDFGGFTCDIQQIYRRHTNDQQVCHISRSDIYLVSRLLISSSLPPEHLLPSPVPSLNLSSSLSAHLLHPGYPSQVLNDVNLRRRRNVRN